MRRRGSILILTLFIMVIISMGVIYISYIIRLQTSITASSIEKIQNYYSMESRFNKLLFGSEFQSEKIIPSIKKHMKSPNGYRDDKFNVLEIEDGIETNYTVNIRYFFNERRLMEIITEAEFDGLKTSIKAYGPIIRDVYEKDNMPLLSYDLDSDSCNQLREVFDILENEIKNDDIPTNFKKISTFDHESLTIRTINSTVNEIVYSSNRGESTDTMEKDVFIIMKNKLNVPIQLRMEDGNHNRILSLNGIIYVEGDLIIDTNFRLNGILIVKDGRIIVKDGLKPVFRGKILTNGSTEFISDIDLKYDKDFFVIYGGYLPGFIDLRFEVIKKL